MADILIDGMKMPRQDDVFIQICADGVAVIFEPTAEPRAVKVVELPEHGDLISKDDAMNAILGEPPEAHYPSWYASIVNEIPAIVPSNKEETE